MKSIFILIGILFTTLICNFQSVAQNAEVFFINNNSAPEAARLDLEIRVMPADTIFIKLNRIRYLHASRAVSVPASTTLKLKFIESLTGKEFYTYDSAIFAPKEFSSLFITGASNDRRFSKFTAYQHPLEPTMVKYNFRHSKLSLEEIDLIVRWTRDVLANDFENGIGNFIYDDEFGDSEYFFDSGDR